MLRITLLFCLALTACDRAETAASPIGVSADAIFVVSAPTLAELRAMSHYVEPLQVDVGADESQPAWFACERAVCVLRRGASAELAQRGDTWLVPDGSGSLVVWGATERADLDAALTRYRAGEPPAAGWAGFIEPRVMLERWKPTNPRSKELVERVTFQASRIDFTAKVAGGAVDAEMRMRGTPGEPVFTGDLGAPRAELPVLTGLAVDPMLGIARVSADPKQLWALFRSVLSAEQRGELEALIETLAADFAVDFDKQVVDALTGHALLFAYEADPARATLSDLVTLRTTSETIVFAVRDREALRRAIDAATQLSKGRLQVQTATETKQEWAWFTDDVIQWSVILGENYLAVVDSPIALDRVRSWQREPAPLPAALKKHGTDGLLAADQRSGVYLNLAALRETLPDAMEAVPKSVTAVTATAEPDGDGELIRLRMLLAP